MNFICCVILNAIEDEEESFWLFQSMILKKCLCNIFIDEMPGVKLHNYIISRLCQDILPSFYEYVLNSNLDIGYFTSKWIVSLFGAFFDMDNSKKIIDIFLLVI